MKLLPRVDGKSICVLIVVHYFLLLIGCGSSKNGLSGIGNKYQYSYKMSVPSDSQKTAFVDEANLLYQDDSLIIQFNFDDAAIHLQLQNLADSYLVVDWGKVRVSHNRKSSTVRHSLCFYADSTNKSISISLPSQGYIRDYLAPTENVYFDGSRWIEKDLFPTWDGWTPQGVATVNLQIGESVVLTMPLWFGSFPKTYVFSFRVSRVEPVSPQKYRLPWRDPRPPNEKEAPALGDQVITVGIVVGVVGFSVYMLTMKKETPADLR